MNCHKIKYKLNAKIVAFHKSNDLQWSSCHQHVTLTIHVILLTIARTGRTILGPTPKPTIIVVIDN